MSRIVRSVTTAWPPEVAFAYMADFRHTAEWDAGVVAARREGDVVALGTAFELTVRIGRRRVPFRYVVTAYEPMKVTFTSRTRALESVDTVTVAPGEGSTVVTYDARISFRGLLRLANPLLALGFRGVADRAVRGLEERLSRPL